LKVRRQGDDFLLNGQKAAWVSCGTIAGSCILFGSFEDSPIGLADGAAFLIPLDLPGITRGKPLEKLGQRTLNQGEIFFSDVRVPRRFLLAEGAETYPLIWEAMIRDANLHMGPQFVGVARAAYDCALDYAKQWVQGGVPIIQHQAVKVRLFDMFRKVEAAPLPRPPRRRRQCRQTRRRPIPARGQRQGAVYPNRLRGGQRCPPTVRRQWPHQGISDRETVP
jgi:alkylation response protein AidB-like acyl-CoA dehydrogenase